LQVRFYYIPLFGLLLMSDCIYFINWNFLHLFALCFQNCIWVTNTDFTFILYKKFLIVQTRFSKDILILLTFIFVLASLFSFIELFYCDIPFEICIPCKKYNRIKIVELKYRYLNSKEFIK
jgi:hypothetical protein